MIGCQEEEVITNIEKADTSQVNLARLENKNILNFENFEELEKAIHEILESDIDILDRSITDLKEKGRISLLLAYNLEEEELEKYGLKRDDIAKVDTGDRVLLHLLNSEGEISINRNIYRIDEDFVYILKENNKENNKEIIKEFLSEFKEGRIKVVNKKLLKYSNSLQVYKHGNNKKEKYAPVKRTEYGNFPNDGSVRVKARQFEGHWFFYSSVGALTKTEQYWNSWVNVETTNRLKFSVYFEAFSIFDPHTPLFGKKLKDDIIKRTYAIDKVFGFSIGSPAPLTFEAQDGLTQHQAGWYGNNSHTVNLYY